MEFKAAILSDATELNFFSFCSDWVISTILSSVIDLFFYIIILIWHKYRNQS